MDIGSGKGYPAGKLSNFTRHPFILDEVQCESLEGFLQSLKFKSEDMQEEVCKLWGKKAKFKGKKKNWYRDQTLYWKGIPYKRDSKDYQELLDRAYDACFTQCASAKRALLATGHATLTHSIGNSQKSRTVLTEQEFCSRLTKLRKKFQLIAQDLIEM